MRRWDAYHRICLLIALIVAGLFAQSQLPTTTAVGKVPDASSKHTHRPVQLRLKQQRGLRLLKAAESEASGLRPEMGARSFFGESPRAMPLSIEAELTGRCRKRS